MRPPPARLALAVAAVLAVVACDRYGLGPPKAASAPADVAEQQNPQASLRAHAGETYSAFAAGVAAYAPEGLGLDAADRTRLWRAMVLGSEGALLTGGGAEALVFSGCADEACEGGLAVVAIDTATGGTFVGVRDAAGADILAPNNRIEALLRLNSPSRNWDHLDPAGR